MWSKYKRKYILQTYYQIAIWETVTELYIHLLTSQTVVPNQAGT